MTNELKRNRNIDVLRALALLLIVIYHIATISGSGILNIPIAKEFIAFGGEIGVTAFFLLSGYGIYYSLLKNPVNDLESYFEFLKKRLMRIVPQYYICLFICKHKRFPRFT